MLAVVLAVAVMTRGEFLYKSRNVECANDFGDRCIYGHRCQAPERLDPTKWPSERGKTCIFGPECVFPPELHNVDTNAVKVTKV